MIVRTSGSCSRICSVRLRSAARSAAVGANPQIAAISSARSGLRISAAPSTPPTRKATTDSTTNSPERTLTPGRLEFGIQPLAEPSGLGEPA